MTSISLLIDGNSLRGWEVSALTHLVDNTACSIDYVIHNTGGGTLKSKFHTAWDMGVWGAVVAGLEVYWTLTQYPPEREPHAINQLQWANNATHIRCSPVEYEGFGNALPEEAIGALSSTDVAIRFGFGVIKRRALDAPSFGMLSFHHGDIRQYRGRPAGFWEYRNHESTGGVTLQRLSETLDGGDLIEFSEVDISDASSWLEVRRRLFRASEPMLTTGIERLLNGEGPVLDPDELGDLYKPPGLRTTVRYLIDEIVPLRNVA